jgi:hypothetical protein
MVKRLTIGMNPLDAVIPVGNSKQIEREEGGGSSFPVKTNKINKERLTVHLPVELIERVKNTVYWTPGLTLAGLAEEALIEALAKREAIRGEPFPARREELKGGRPMK